MPSATRLNADPLERVKIGTPCAVVPLGAMSVSSERVNPKNETTGPGGAGTVGLGVGDCDGVRLAVPVRVPVGLTVAVLVGVRLRVGLPVGEGVVGVTGVNEPVRVGDKVRVGETVGLTWIVAVHVADGVNVGCRVKVDVGEDVRLGVGVCEGLGVYVRLGVRVGRGTNGVKVGAGVNVGGKAPGPTRRTSCCDGPRLPATSRRRAVSTVSPVTNASVRDTWRQNCTSVPTPRKLELPN